MTMVPSNEVNYSAAGNTSLVKNNNSISSEPASLLTFRGSAVCETMPFDVDFSGEPTELLRREKQCGSYYTMLPHSNASSDAGQYRSDHRSIYIYNADVDRFEKIQLEEALDSCFRFTENGVNASHVGVVDEYGIPSAKEVSMRDDPLMCHHSNKSVAELRALGADAIARPVPNGVCKYLGDLPLNHLRREDIQRMQDARGFNAGDYTRLPNPTNSGYNPGDVATYDLTMEPNLINAFNQAWDPVLSVALHAVSYTHLTLPTNREV